MISVSRYNEIMEHIELTDEMRERIISNVSAKRRRRRISRIVSAAAGAAACAVLVFGAFAVIRNTGNLSKSPDKETVTTQTSYLGVGGTYTYGSISYKSAAELSEAFGIEINDLEHLPFEVKNVCYSIMFGNFTEVDYYGVDDEECCYRVGRDTEDITGEYDEFTTVETAMLNGCKVTLKGYGADYRIASWISGGHFCSVSLNKGTDRDTLLEIADSAMK